MGGAKTSSLGEAVRRRRLELGLTQEALAAQVGDGVRQADISRLERGGIGLPRRSRLLALAAALDLPAGDLLARSGWAGADLRPADRLAADGAPADGPPAGGAPADRSDGRANGPMPVAAAGPADAPLPAALDRALSAGPGGREEAPAANPNPNPNLTRLSAAVASSQVALNRSAFLLRESRRVHSMVSEPPGQREVEGA